jgi:hypothetical protein
VERLENTLGTTVLVEVIVDKGDLHEYCSKLPIHRIK